MLLKRARGHAGSIDVDAETLRLSIGQRKVAVPRGDLVQGWTAPGSWGVRAFLDARDGDVYAIELETEAEANALLEAAGVSAEKRVVTTRLAPPTQNPALGCVALLASAFLTVLFVAAMPAVLGLAGNYHPSQLFILGFVAVFGLLIIEIAFPPILTVGLDGLRIRTLLRRRFVPLASVVDSAPTPEGVALALENGRRVELNALRRPTENDAIPVLRNIVGRAVSASALRRNHSKAAEALDRRGERFDAWVARLTKLGGTGSYRDGNLGAEALAEVMEDAQAPADRRLGAALTLAKLGGDGGRERVRIAAGSTADVDLRAALEAAAEEELTEDVAARALAGWRRRNRHTD